MTLIYNPAKKLQKGLKSGFQNLFHSLRIAGLILVFNYIFIPAFSQCNVVIGSTTNPLEGCSGFSIQFNDLSSGVISRVWNFGDGSPNVIDQNPTHSFTANLNDTSYVVTLTITCAAGTSSVQKTVKVFSKPRVEFSSDKTSVCAITDSICLVNRSNNAAGNKYTWNFNDGTTSDIYSPCKIYSTPGIYDLSLTIINKQGCLGDSSMSKYINVLQIPSVAFNVNAFVGCLPFTAEFSNISDTLDSNYSNWTWDFGDGSELYYGITPPPHTYTKTGEYTIKLGATNNIGCSNYSTQKIMVRPSPVAQFNSSSPACINENLVVTFTGSYNASPVFDWDFDSPVVTSGSGVGPYSLRWSEAGNKNITLSVKENGCSSSVSKKIQVNPITKVFLNIAADYDTICSNQEVTFVASPINYANYKYYVDNVVVQDSRDNKYIGKGFKNNARIYAGVTDINGCTQIISDTLTLKVIDSPLINLTSSALNDTICIATPVVFIALPAGADQYTFFVGNTPVQKTGSNVFNTSTLTNNDRVYALADKNSCSSDQSNNVFTNIKNPLPAPQVNCGTSTLTTVEFQWDPIPGAIAYEVSLDNGLTFKTPSSGNLGLKQFSSGMAGGEVDSIIVRAKDASICGFGQESALQRCKAVVCEEISYNLQGQTREICEGEQVILNISQISPTTSSISWNSGSYGTDSSFEFTSAADRIINVSVKNNAQVFCPSVDKSFNIIVSKRIPLTIQSSAGNNTVNIGTPILFTVQPSDLRVYSFYDNNVLVQQGSDNTYISTNPVNGHTVLATAQHDGCIESTTPLTMKVIVPLSIPQVNYSYSTEDSIMFAWDPVPGAAGYMVSINGESFIVPSSGVNGLSHVVGPLSSGDAATISVMALGDGLTTGNSEVSQPSIGFAEYCNAFEYSIVQDSSICQGDSIILRVDGLNLSNFSIVWGSMPPTKSKVLQVSPSSDTVISVAIRNLDKPFCPRQISYVNIKVIVKPVKISLTSSVADTVIFVGNTIRFTASPLGYETYEFYKGSNLISEGFSNIFETTDLGIGESKISARARNKTCIGKISNEIQKLSKPILKTPQLNVGPTTDTTVSYMWDPIPDAIGYIISVDGVPYDTIPADLTDLPYVFDNMNLGDSVKVSITAVAELPTGNSNPSEEITGYAIECPLVSYLIYTNNVVSPYDSICEGEQVTLSISDVIPNTYMVSWNGGTLGNVLSVNYVGINDTIIKVSVKNTAAQAQCPLINKQFEIAVTGNAAITLSSDSPNDTSCAGKITEFRVLPEEFNRYVFYEGSTVLQDSSISWYLNLNKSNGGNISAKVYSNGCVSTSNIIQTTVIVPADLRLTASKTGGELCQNELIKFTATPGFANYYFYDSTSLIQETNQNIVDLNVNSSLITVSAIDENNCESKSNDVLVYVVLPLPQNVNITSSADSICFNDPVFFTATPSNLTKYRFYNKDTDLFQEGPGFTYTTDSLRAGYLISVVGVDSNGCASQPAQSLLPYLRPYPETSIVSDADGLCLNDSITIKAIIDNTFAGVSYYWSTGAVKDSIRISPAYSTTISLFANYGACKNKVIDSKDIFVDRQTPPIAYAGEDSTICILDSTQLIAEGGFNFSWNTDSTLSDINVYNPYARPSVTTTYIVKITNNYCYSTDSVTVFIDLCLEDLTNPVPQIITPNGDGINDFWFVENVEYFEDNRVEIFNRWGNLVFKASPYENTWDGKNNKGADLPGGTYYYIIDLGNGAPPRSGFIIVHR